MHLVVGRWGHFMGLARELDLQQLLRLQAAMPVSRSAEGCWDSGTSSVNSLENALEVNASSDFFDKDWC